MKIFHPKIASNFCCIHETCQNVPERVALACVSCSDDRIFFIFYISKQTILVRIKKVKADDPRKSFRMKADDPMVYIELRLECKLSQ